MKTHVEQINSTRVRIDVEVPFSDFDDDFTKAYKTIAHQVRIPGFRPGKAPAKVLEAKLGRGVILDQVINEAIPRKYAEAVSENNVKALSRPDIDIKEINDGKEVKFSAEVDIRPEIDIPDLNGLAVEVEPALSVDEIAEKELELLRKRFGTLKPVNRKSKKGDQLTLAITSTIDGEQIPEATTDALPHTVGEDSPLEGLDKAVKGLKKEETTTFTTTIPAGKHKDKEAEISVEVKDVQEQELPELNDEFAQLASKFDTLDELKADVKKNAEGTREAGIITGAIDKTLEKLVDSITFDVPQSVVDAQAENRINQVLQQLGGDENLLIQYLEMQGSSVESFRDETRTAVLDEVKAELLLDALAEKYEITAGQEDIGAEMVRQARQYGISPQEFMQEVLKANAFTAVYAGAQRTKTLEHVVGLVDIKDTNGTDIDVLALLNKHKTNAEESVKEQAAESESEEE